MGSHEQSAVEDARKKLLESLSPAFNANTLDVLDVAKLSSDPVLLALLVFKLAEERQKTNQLLSEWKDKNAKQLDDIMFELKTAQYRQAGAGLMDSTSQSGGVGNTKTVVLPEPDQKIIAYVRQSGSATAQEIQIALNYRGKNAACQRLNNLARNGLLKKMQSGKRVVFLPPGA